MAAGETFYHNVKSVLIMLITLAALVVAFFLARGFYNVSRTIFDLLAENRELRAAIANLSAESQIGYARVLSQETREGQLHTTIRFVETARDNPRQSILTREFELPGDAIYFDALVVKFSPDYVQDGRERALYLWRRVFSEDIAARNGFSIEDEQLAPKRYADILDKLSSNDSKLFWTEIWNLAHDPGRLRRAGVAAVSGKAVYSQLRPGFVYYFKIGNLGALSVEAAPAP